NEFDKLIEMQPNRASYYMHRANVFTRMEQFDKALKDLDKAIEISPDDPSCLYNKAYTLFKSGGDSEKSLQLVNEAIKLNCNSQNFI
ncbi:MAG: tetratricopeptide repeat protein, partial [Flavisolibacter sp.]|nr:tetratricopeptide repeat protein [Flavisolibacter sp.]